MRRRQRFGSLLTTWLPAVAAIGLSVVELGGLREIKDSERIAGLPSIQYSDVGPFRSIASDEIFADEENVDVPDVNESPMFAEDESSNPTSIPPVYGIAAPGNNPDTIAVPPPEIIPESKVKPAAKVSKAIPKKRIAKLKMQAKGKSKKIAKLGKKKTKIAIHKKSNKQVSKAKKPNRQALQNKNRGRV